jgi:hypothetical protein
LDSNLVTATGVAIDFSSPLQVMGEMWIRTPRNMCRQDLLPVVDTGTNITISPIVPDTRNVGLGRKRPGIPAFAVMAVTDDNCREFRSSTRL